MEDQSETKLMLKFSSKERQVEGVQVVIVQDMDKQRTQGLGIRVNLDRIVSDVPIKSRSAQTYY